MAQHLRLSDGRRESPLRGLRGSPRSHREESYRSTHARSPARSTVAPTVGIEDGPLFAGAKLHVVDLKLHMAVRWFASGNVDHIPATIFAGYPKLKRAHDAVRDDSRVKAWYAKT